MVQLLYLTTYFPQEFPRSYKSSPLALVDQAHPTGMWHKMHQPESFPETYHQNGKNWPNYADTTQEVWV